MTDSAFHGSVVVRRPKGPLDSLAQWLLRQVNPEVDMVHRYNTLMAEGNRSTPGVLLHGESRSVGIKSAPTRMNPKWVLSDGREVATEEIHTLDTIRVLGGYD